MSKISKLKFPLKVPGKDIYQELKIHLQPLLLIKDVLEEKKNDVRLYDLLTYTWDKLFDSTAMCKTQCKK